MEGKVFSKLSVFKFRSLKDSNTAFVIAYDEKYATQLLRERSQLPVDIIGRRDIGEIPAAQEHYDHKGPSVWISNLDPF